jgi:hypothetical protein
MSKIQKDLDHVANLIKKSVIFPSFIIY